MLPDNIDRTAQKGFKVCFQTDYQGKLGGHFYIDIYIAAIVVLVSCLPLFSFLISFFKAFALTGRKADCAYAQGVTLG